MHHLFLFVMDKTFDLPLLFMSESVKTNLEFEIDFKHEE